MKPRRLIRVAPVVGLVWLLAGIPTSSQAQFETGPFAGFALEAWGASFSMIYDDPNGPIPAHPTGEMHAAYGLAALSDGFGHGIATEIWPGPTAATAGPFIEDSFWDGVEEGSEGQFPPEQLGRPALTPRQWPVAAETFEPAGPHTSDVPPNAHAHSGADTVYAKASTVPLHLPGAFELDAGATTAQSRVTKVKADDGSEVDAAVAQVVTTAADILIPTPVGAIKIDKVTTTAEASSDGERPTVSGQTVVSGMSIAGQGYTIDENGIHAGGDSQPNPLVSGLNEATEQALADSGISITLAKPIDTVDGPTAGRSVGGLIVRMNSARFDEFVSSLPDELEQQIRASISTQHDLTLVFGAANVKASALQAFEFVLVEPDFPSGGGTSVLGGTLDSGSFDGGFTAGSPVAGGGPGTAGAPVATQPAFAGPIGVEGVNAAAVILGLALVLGAARGLKLMSDRLLVAGAGAACPLGEDG